MVEKCVRHELPVTAPGALGCDLCELRAELARVTAERGLLIACDVCAEVLTEPGALVFGPPDSEGRTQKKHVCVRCLPVLLTPCEVKR